MLAMFILGGEYKYKYDMIEELAYSLRFINERLQPHEVRPKFWIGNRLVTLGDWNT
jgi:formylglycine-generating enzyme required for sulfatase activity